MPQISGALRGEGVQAVVFALQILEYLAQHRSTVGVTDLARVFDTTKSRMHRHLQTLVAAGYVMREDETERYRSGARLIAFGRAVADNFELTNAARPVMESLRAALGHPVALSQPELDGMRVIATIAGKSAFEIGVKPGSMLPANATAQGKLMLAYGSEAVAARTPVEVAAAQHAVYSDGPRRAACRARAGTPPRLGDGTEPVDHRAERARSANLRRARHVRRRDRDRRLDPVYSRDPCRQADPPGG